MTFEDKYQSKIQRKKDNMILTFDFDLPCRTSPRRCSRGSPGGWSWSSFLQNLYINTKGRFTEQIMIIDLKMAEIFDFSTFEKNKTKTSYRSLCYQKIHKRLNESSCEVILNFFVIFSKMS